MITERSTNNGSKINGMIKRPQELSDIFNASHELRTPLNAIIGFTDLALKSSDISDIKTYLVTIYESADAISDYLDYMKEHLYADPDNSRAFTFITDNKPIKTLPAKKKNKETKEALTDIGDIKVLAVDDTALNLVLIKKFLSKENMVVTSVHSALKAIELCEYKDFDIILLDYMMPVLDGMECIKILRKKGVTTPVIMLTANDDPYIREEFLMYGDGFLNKPIDFKKLIDMIYRLTDRK